MKQHNSATNSIKTIVSHPSAKSTSKIPPKPPIPSQTTRAKSGPKDKPKSEVGSQKVKQLEEGRKVINRTTIRPVVQQHAPRRPRIEVKKNEDESSDHGNEMGLKENYDSREDLIKNLQCEVLELKAELSKAQALNVELQTCNKTLSDDLAAAQVKIAAFTISDHQMKRDTVEEYETPTFKDVQKLIANKLQHPKPSRESISESFVIKASAIAPTHQVSTACDAQLSASANAPAPPPPPPPPLRRPAPVRAATTQKAPSFAKFYNSILKHDNRQDSPLPTINDKPMVTNAHSSIIGEIQSRSAHLLAIKADIQTKGEFIDSLIQKVLAAAYADIEDVLEFVDWLDCELSSLADERAVLKHFKWPERKADAMREAAVEYRDLKLLENEISSYKDDFMLPCDAALKKMAILLDKSERSIQRLMRLRSSVVLSYRDFNIPTDWMLDSGIVRKIKCASMKLAKMYVKRVSIELELTCSSERQSAQQALLLRGLHFADRAHQFAGGLDSETLCALEEIKQRVPEHLIRSRELSAGIPSS